MVLAYWANLLILQECLNQCEAGPERPFEASNRRLATDILRCTEHVGHGVMGPYRVGYGLRIAYDFVDRPTQLWTLMMVDKYNKRYEALSRDVYPENPLIRDEDGKSFVMGIGLTWTRWFEMERTRALEHDEHDH
ncbi:hypothetical protein M406DRAFT_354165 [Cryphonectria parasitica EP155]|uniref:Uncharacterized protein n=1 Tax=Cryphonectria parasitica (strain ATCC 38755 / EP155) TaxID=660469 RepID=A0A9P4YBL1_CRYP1|nr:uncharacterized protein M406DRAFT_354165 [Cryphonectria parasitica EP155]KAF3769887.1 hypothetical protein M406DRAFT_354165 [Cryphonectria parasitica EP155]